MCGPTCSFDHTVWDGCARDDGTDSCNGFEQHNWRCFALSGQGHPSLRPAPLIQRASHTKVVHPHKEWQEIPAYVSWHSTPGYLPSSSSHPHVTREALVPEHGEGKRKHHAMRYRPCALDGSCTRRWPLSDHSCGSEAVGAREPGETGTARGKPSLLDPLEGKCRCS